jgi:hypothetical protein
MRKLTPREFNAIQFLVDRGGSYCLSDYTGPFASDVLATLDSLVKKKQATVESTDDGPRYTLTLTGRMDVA